MYPHAAQVQRQQYTTPATSPDKGFIRRQSQLGAVAQPSPSAGAHQPQLPEGSAVTAESIAAQPESPAKSSGSHRASAASQYVQPSAAAAVTQASFTASRSASQPKAANPNDSRSSDGSRPNLSRSRSDQEVAPDQAMPEVNDMEQQWEGHFSKPGSSIRPSDPGRLVNVSYQRISNSSGNAHQSRFPPYAFSTSTQKNNHPSYGSSDSSSSSTCVDSDLNSQAWESAHYLREARRKAVNIALTAATSLEEVHHLMVQAYDENSLDAVGLSAGGMNIARNCPRGRKKVWDQDGSHDLRSRGVIDSVVDLMVGEVHAWLPPAAIVAFELADATSQSMLHRGPHTSKEVSNHGGHSISGSVDDGGGGGNSGGGSSGSMFAAGSAKTGCSIKNASRPQTAGIASGPSDGQPMKRQGSHTNSQHPSSHSHPTVRNRNSSQPMNLPPALPIAPHTHPHTSSSHVPHQQPPPTSIPPLWEPPFKRTRLRFREVATIIYSVGRMNALRTPHHLSTLLHAARFVLQPPSLASLGREAATKSKAAAAKAAVVQKAASKAAGASKSAVAYVPPTVPPNRFPVRQSSHTAPGIIASPNSNAKHGTLLTTTTTTSIVDSSDSRSRTSSAAFTAPPPQRGQEVTMLAWGLARLEAKPSPVFMVDLLSNSQQCLIALNARHAASPHRSGLHPNIQTQQRYPSQLPQRSQKLQTTPNPATLGRPVSMSPSLGESGRVREVDVAGSAGSRMLLPWQERELQEQQHQQWQPVRERKLRASQGDRDELSYSQTPASGYSSLGDRVAALGQGQRNQIMQEGRLAGKDSRLAWQVMQQESLDSSDACFIDFDSSSMMQEAGSRRRTAQDGVVREYRTTQELACLIWAVAQLLPDSVPGSAKAASAATSSPSAAAHLKASPLFSQTHIIAPAQASRVTTTFNTAAGFATPAASITRPSPETDSGKAPSPAPSTVALPASAASKRLARKRRTALIAAYTPLTESAMLAATSLTLKPAPDSIRKRLPQPQPSEQGASENLLSHPNASHTPTIQGERESVEAAKSALAAAAAAETNKRPALNATPLVSPLQGLKLLWFSHFECASLPLLHLCSPHELAVIADSVGAVGVKPGSAWMEALLGAAAVEVVHDSYSPGHMALMLRGLRQIGYNPGHQWLLIFLTAAYRQLPRFFPHTLSTMLVSLAGFAPRSDVSSSSSSSRDPNPVDVQRAVSVQSSPDLNNSSSDRSNGFCDFTLSNVAAVTALSNDRDMNSSCNDQSRSSSIGVSSGRNLTQQNIQQATLVLPPSRPSPSQVFPSQPPPQLLPPTPLIPPPPPRQPTPGWIPDGYLVSAAAQLQKTLSAHSASQMVDCLTSLVRLGYSPEEGGQVGYELVCGVLEETRGSERGGRLGTFSRGECRQLMQVLVAWDVRPGSLWLADFETASANPRRTPGQTK